MKINAECDLCEHKDKEFLFDQEDRMHNIPGIFKLYKCKNCNLISLEPQPSDKVLQRHYPSKNYYSFKELPESFFRKAAYASYVKKNRKFNNFLLRPLFRSTRIIPRGNILDIGCGSGTFLKSMKNLGMNAYGVELGSFNKKLVETYGLNVFHGILSDAKYNDETFDVVTMNHAFEHVRNPTEILKEIKRILKMGGCAIIGVPNTDSWVFNLFGKYWIPIDSPRHLFLYNKKNLRGYAKKVGLEVVGIRCFGNSTFWQSLRIFLDGFGKKKEYSHDRKFSENKILHYLILPISIFFNFIRKGYTIEITLRKK